MPTLYLNGWQTAASLDNGQVHTAIKKEEEIQHQKIPLLHIDRVVITGEPQVTMPLMQAFLRRKIPVVFLNNHQRWLGSINSFSSGQNLRPVLQYRQIIETPQERLQAAQLLIASKIHNMRRTLQHHSANRHETDLPSQHSANMLLKQAEREVFSTKSVSALMGVEGRSSAIYFHRLADFFPEATPLRKRAYHPPCNESNALLSITYQIVTSELEGELRAAGLDPSMGVLHAITAGRPSLACDLLESFRAPLCDNLAIRLLRRRQLTPKNFSGNSQDGVYLTDTGRRIFFQEYEKRMLAPFLNPVTQRTTSFRGLLRLQVEEFVRWLEQGKEPKFHRAA